MTIVSSNRRKSQPGSIRKVIVLNAYTFRGVSVIEHPGNNFKGARKRHTARDSTVTSAQETAGVVPRKPSFKRDLTAVRSRNSHGNPAHVLCHGLRGITTAWWIVRQGQVRSTGNIVGEVDLDIGQVNLVCEARTVGLEGILGQG